LERAHERTIRKRGDGILKLIVLFEVHSDNTMRLRAFRGGMRGIKGENPLWGGRERYTTQTDEDEKRLKNSLGFRWGGTRRLGTLPGKGQ